MVQLRLTEPHRFVIVGTPKYFAKRGRPQLPEDLLDHECITSRRTNGALYAWEIERGRKTWQIPVRGGVITNEGLLCVTMARLGLGLAYALEPAVRDEVERGEFETVPAPYAPTVPGFFLYYQRHAQRSLPLKLFADTANAVLRQRERTR